MCTGCQLGVISHLPGLEGVEITTIFKNLSLVSSKLIHGTYWVPIASLEHGQIMVNLTVIVLRNAVVSALGSQLKSGDKWAVSSHPFLYPASSEWKLGVSQGLYVSCLIGMYQCNVSL